METRPQKQTRLTCEQVYNVWATEPYLIQVLDIRPRETFEKSHIPGAAHVEENHLAAAVDALEGRLGIIIATEAQQSRLSGALPAGADAVFMRDCRKWLEAGHPVAGASSAESFRHWITQGESMNPTRNASSPIFYQLFEPESSTYTYLIGDGASGEAALIDPVLETVERDLKLVQELGLKLIYVIDTHIHADHVTGAGEIRRRSGAKSAVSATAKVDCVDIPLVDGQELLLGTRKIRALATPGHTDSCMSFYFEGMVFTGDTLLIRGTGRTDFQQGSSEKLYDSVHGKLFALPEDTRVYPGHDYKGMTASSIALEKKFNPRLGGGKTKEEFKRIMSELKLANPKKIHEAVPANLACGQLKAGPVLSPRIEDGIPVISPEEVHAKLGKVRLIDVRRPDEFNNELGHIEGAELVTLGPDLQKLLDGGDRSQEIVFVCRSGARSGNATAAAQQLGYKHTINMSGGMIRWNELGLPVERN